jgi:hypothetical protein
VYAASKINGKSVKKNTLPGNRVKKGTLPGNRLQGNTVKGSKIDESSLGQVPSANIANSSGAVRVVYNDGPFSLPFLNTTNRLSTLNLGDGKYALSGKVTLHNSGGLPADDVMCFLFAGENFFDIDVVDIPVGGDVAIPLQTATYFPRANSVALDCNPKGATLTASYVRVSAVQVADITYGPTPPPPTGP